MAIVLCGCPDAPSHPSYRDSLFFPDAHLVSQSSQEATAQKTSDLVDYIYDLYFSPTSPHTGVLLAREFQVRVGCAPKIFVSAKVYLSQSSPSQVFEERRKLELRIERMKITMSEDEIWRNRVILDVAKLDFFKHVTCASYEKFLHSPEESETDLMVRASRLCHGLDPSFVLHMLHAVFSPQRNLPAPAGLEKFRIRKIFSSKNAPSVIGIYAPTEHGGGSRLCTREALTKGGDKKVSLLGNIHRIGEASLVMQQWHPHSYLGISRENVEEREKKSLHKFLNEPSISSQLIARGVPHIARMWPAEYFYKESQSPTPVILMHYCKEGTLRECLRKLNPQQRYALAVQFYEALAGMHETCIHGDIKLENILCQNVAGNFQLYMTDFGSVQEVNTPPIAGKEIDGLITYPSPELRGIPVLDRTPKDTVDVWAAANILYGLLKGQMLFSPSFLSASVSNETYREQLATSEETLEATLDSKNPIHNALKASASIDPARIPKEKEILAVLRAHEPFFVM